MSNNQQVKKVSPYWDDFIKNIWKDYDHPEDIKEPTIKCWRSWEEGAAQ